MSCVRTVSKGDFSLKKVDHTHLARSVPRNVQFTALGPLKGSLPTVSEGDLSLKNVDHTYLARFALRNVQAAEKHAIPAYVSQYFNRTARAPGSEKSKADASMRPRRSTDFRVPRDQKAEGFTILWVIMSIVVILAICGAGWYLWTALAQETKRSTKKSRRSRSTTVGGDDPEKVPGKDLAHPDSESSHTDSVAEQSDSDTSDSFLSRSWKKIKSMTGWQKAATGLALGAGVAGSILALRNPSPPKDTPFNALASEIAKVNSPEAKRLIKKKLEKEKKELNDVARRSGKDITSLERKFSPEVREAIRMRRDVYASSDHRYDLQEKTILSTLKNLVATGYDQPDKDSESYYAQFAILIGVVPPARQVLCVRIGGCKCDTSHGWRWFCECWKNYEDMCDQFKEKFPDQDMRDKTEAVEADNFLGHHFYTAVADKECPIEFRLIDHNLPSSHERELLVPFEKLIASRPDQAKVILDSIKNGFKSTPEDAKFREGVYAGADAFNASITYAFKDNLDSKELEEGESEYDEEYSFFTEPSDQVKKIISNMDECWSRFKVFYETIEKSPVLKNQFQRIHDPSEIMSTIIKGMTGSTISDHNLRVIEDSFRRSREDNQDETKQDERIAKYIRPNLRPHLLG